MFVYFLRFYSSFIYHNIKCTVFNGLCNVKTRIIDKFRTLPTFKKFPGGSRCRLHIVHHHHPHHYPHLTFLHSPPYSAKCLDPGAYFPDTTHKICAHWLSFLLLFEIFYLIWGSDQKCIKYCHKLVFRYSYIFIWHKVLSCVNHERFDLQKLILKIVKYISKL